MTDRELLQQALDALEIGHVAALEEATLYHATMKGYRPARHAALDADVKRIADAIAAIRQRLAQPEPEGWKLVPVEPTPEMWKAVNKLDDEMTAGGYDGKGCTIEQAWYCMLAAAPQKGTL